MDELIKTLTSFSWWGGVVGVGVGINLLSAYAKSPFDALLGAVSKRWQTRTERSRSKRVAQIMKLRGNQHLQLIFIAREQRKRLTEIAYLLLAILFSTLSFSIKLLARFSVDAAQPPTIPWLMYLAGGMTLFCLFIAISLRVSAITDGALFEEAISDTENQ